MPDGLSRIAPLKKAARLSEQVYDTLRRELRRGRIAPGARLTEVTLAAELGVSRTPVREALQRLAAEGILDSTARGFVPRTVTADDLRDIYALRRLIEPAAAAEAAAHATPAGVVRFQQALEAARTAHARGDGDAFRLANGEFRDRLLALVPNRRLAKAAELYDDHVRFLRIASLDAPEVRALALGGMERLFEAVRRGDAEAARAAMVAHLGAAEETSRAHMAAQDETTPETRKDTP